MVPLAFVALLAAVAARLLAWFVRPVVTTPTVGTWQMQGSYSGRVLWTNGGPLRHLCFGASQFTQHCGPIWVRAGLLEPRRGDRIDAIQVEYPLNRDVSEIGYVVTAVHPK